MAQWVTATGSSAQAGTIQLGTGDNRGNRGLMREFGGSGRTLRGHHSVTAWRPHKRALCFTPQPLFAPFPTVHLHGYGLGLGAAMPMFRQHALNPAIGNEPEQRHGHVETAGDP